MTILVVPGNLKARSKAEARSRRKLLARCPQRLPRHQPAPQRLRVDFDEAIQNRVVFQYFRCPAFRLPRISRSQAEPAHRGEGRQSVHDVADAGQV